MKSLSLDEVDDGVCDLTASPGLASEEPDLGNVSVSHELIDVFYVVVALVSWPLFFMLICSQPGFEMNCVGHYLASAFISGIAAALWPIVWPMVGLVALCSIRV